VLNYTFSGSIARAAINLVGNWKAQTRPPPLCFPPAVGTAEGKADVVSLSPSPTLTPRAFVDKWRYAANLKERSAAQEHFIDLCRLIGHPTPAEDDPTGERFTFEAGAAKHGGGEGWADVWKRGAFAWEYKGRHADLRKAYDQLLQYREALENPPLLIVSDLATIEISTNFTNTVKQTYTLTLDDLLDTDKRRILHDAFFDPEKLKARQTPAQVTERAAGEFATLAEQLRAYGGVTDVGAAWGGRRERMLSRCRTPRRVPPRSDAPLRGAEPPAPIAQRHHPLQRNQRFEGRPGSHDPLQSEPHLAPARAQGARRCGLRRLRLAARPRGRGDPGAAARAQPGAGGSD